MVNKIKMNVNEKLELDYLIEEVSRNTITVNKDPNGSTINYVSKEIGVFDPQGTGTYELDINGQIIEIEVTDIPDSAIHQWKFDEGSGTTAGDSNGNNDLSLSGMTWTSDASAEGGYVLDFDGTDDTADGSAISAFAPSNDHSFAITLDLDNFNTNPSAAEQVGVSSNGSGINSEIGISFGNSTSDRYELAFYDSNSNLVGTGSADVSAYSGLTRICHTWDSSALSLNIYINGSSVSNDSNGANIDGASSGFYLGHNGNDNKYADGRMDYPIVYDSPLDLSEIEEDYNRQPWS
jgi:hypothetical protein